MPQCLRSLLCLLLSLPVFAVARPGVLTTEHVKAQLLVHAPEGVSPGKPVWLGLLIEHQPHWHTYWKNSGDSGIPTTLSWQMPAGVTAEAIQWPTPKRLPLGPSVNYGYEGQLLLPVPLAIAKDFKGDALDVRLRADWLVCKESCIPEFGEFRLNLPRNAAVKVNARLFERALAARPVTPGSAQATGHVDTGSLVVRVAGLSAEFQGRPLDVFIADAGVIDHAARAEQRWTDKGLSLRMPLSAQRSESPLRMEAVLALPQSSTAVQVAFAVDGGWPALGSTGQDSKPQAIKSLPADPISVAIAVAFAFIGGLLLNLMPCVFPILSLKVIGFARHADDRRTLSAGGVAYTAGVVLSFLALAGILLALRSAGAALGWGFQLQTPGFVAALAIFFTLIGLNLAGVFEIGNLAPSQAAAFTAKRPLLDHTLTGVLAVAVASPCTAPFMGVALGAALTLPTFQALAIFVALGAGMAAPYLVATAWPGLGQRLPRSGPWLLRFKVLMSFPMFATVVWLVWVLGQQVGIDAVAAMLAVLVAVAFAAWVAGTDFKRRGRWSFGTVAAVTLAATVIWAWPAISDQSNAASTLALKSPDARWQTWSRQAVEQARAAGRPVFVDFTAAWCVTCQYNKRATLADTRLLADLDARHVSFFRADWTKRDPSITEALNGLGRNGVPVYALYGPGQTQPRLLSEILSVSEIREAIAAWPDSRAPTGQAAATPRSL